ncbi:MAG TPA: methyltransferase domain-containing protein [Gemmatimonadales bacterium]|nr:methyltransferase domain-containing protein [Gemmatimonadales bacterium]
MTEDFDFRTSGDSFLALRCLTCGSVFLSLVPADEAQPRVYPTEYFAAHASPWRDALARGTRVLDLGPSVGADHVRRLAQEAGAYDLVRLDLTLECAPDPLAVLHAVAAALRPGGRVLVRFNNLRSPAFGWFGGRHWGGYDTPRQRRVLTSDGLATLARAAGLELVETRAVAMGEAWVRSFHRWCADWQAPSWIAARFADSARASLGLFRLVELALRSRRRSALLIATLQRPETEVGP